MLDDEKEICKYGTPLEPLDEGISFNVFKFSHICHT